jgi:hypothetical protein
MLILSHLLMLFAGGVLVEAADFYLMNKRHSNGLIGLALGLIGIAIALAQGA